MSEWDITKLIFVARHYCDTAKDCLAQNQDNVSEWDTLGSQGQWPDFSVELT